MKSAGLYPVDQWASERRALLGALSGELVWVSTRTGEANDVVCPQLGLPPLPVLGWSDAAAEEEPERGVRWKTVSVTRWAAGRPFVWLDDETTDADRCWVAAHHSQPALLHRVDPYLGLTDADFAAVLRWLHQHNDNS